MHRLDDDGERLWPQAVEDYLFQTDWPGGYAYTERETGVYPVQDFINGPLYDALKSRAEDVVNNNQVPELKAVLPPPIAVQGESPGSGLFSFDKFSSLPLLLDSIREDCELGGAGDALRKLFLVPHAEVLRLETANGRVTRVVVALADPAEPKNKSRARVVRLNLKSSAMVLLAGNTINSTRLALNSFPRPAVLNSNGELMGRNLMYHARSNYIWRVRRSALDLPPPDPASIKTAALHIAGSASTAGGGQGHFHFQFYAAPNMDVPMFPGASRDPERFLYQMAPNIEDLESILEAQRGMGNDRVVIGIRTVGESFGDRTSPVGSNPGVSWMNVNPYGGEGDDVYMEGGNELRIPKAYVNLVKTGEDIDVWTAQDQAAFAFIDALAGQAQGGTGGTGPQPGATVEVIAQVPVNLIPDDGYRMENTPGGRFFVGRFNGQYRVIDGTCTHEGCFVNWDGAQGRFSCPCHTASFAVDGSKISGPPPSPLYRPDFRLQNGNLEIIQAQDSASPVEYMGGGSDGIGTTYHESGTLWMGADFAKSVTDINGRFHHVTNAYCVDQALFPTVGSANPVLTGIALSRRIADSIIERYTSAEPVSGEPGFETLYHGNLEVDGWQVVAGGSRNFFDVSDPVHPIIGAGIDTGTPSLGVLWYTQDSFRDFILRLDWRAFDITANSGIFVRMPAPLGLDSDFYNSTIEIQIDEHGRDSANGIHGSPLHKTGAVYGVFPARLWAAKVVQPRDSGGSACWNSCEIEVQGQNIAVRINGVPVAGGVFPALLPIDAPASDTTKREEGYIGLQCHTEVVQFRNVRIKRL
jgi:Rieske Fe-S protein